jgi:hypothetical protein
MFIKYDLKGNDSINNKLYDTIVSNGLDMHSFSSGLNNDNIYKVLGNFLAMSQAFPYIQSVAYKDLVWSCIENNQDISLDIEITSVVGAFLVWDEFGGHYKTLLDGNKGLPRILDTSAFHANLLKEDIKNLLNIDDIKPIYSLITKEYLTELQEGLSSDDRIIRCACMVAFENHAGNMLLALWNSLEKIYKDIDKNSLIYFSVHVGDNDPAEIYHIEMTNKMIELLISEDEIDIFLNYFKKFYKLNYDWCEDIKKL